MAMAVEDIWKHDFCKASSLSSRIQLHREETLDYLTKACNSEKKASALRTKACYIVRLHLAMRPLPKPLRHMIADLMEVSQFHFVELHMCCNAARVDPTLADLERECDLHYKAARHYQRVQKKFLANRQKLKQLCL